MEPRGVTAEIRERITSGVERARDAVRKEIADRLFLSVRTVEGHIYRACAKVDATDRAGLASALARGHRDAARIE